MQGVTAQVLEERPAFGGKVIRRRRISSARKFSIFDLQLSIGWQLKIENCNLKISYLFFDNREEEVLHADK